MIFDMHLHTSLSSCTSIPVEDVIDRAKDTGLDGICITDHETMAAGRYLKEGLQTNGLTVILGMEYETREGDFLLFGPFEELKSGLDAVDLLRHVHQNGGVAIGAHPFRAGRSLNETLVKDNFCGIIESVNGRNRHENSEILNRWRKKYSFAEVGGSDAHSLKEVGSSATRFTVPITSRSDLIHALRKGLCAPTIS